MARPSCPLSTSNPRRSVERLSFIRCRTISVIRFSSFDIFLVIAFRRFSPGKPFSLSSPKLSFVPLLLTSFFSLLPENLILKTENSVRGQPSTQWNRRPCEPRRLLRSQEYRHLRHIWRLPEASQGDQGDPPRPQRVPLSAGVE